MLRVEDRATKGLFSFSCTAKPPHSCKDIRDSRDSKGDGEYWIDPERSGNTLKVYCDMTTDGGSIRNFLIFEIKITFFLTHA